MESELNDLATKPVRVIVMGTSGWRMTAQIQPVGLEGELALPLVANSASDGSDGGYHHPQGARNHQLVSSIGKLNHSHGPSRNQQLEIHRREHGSQWRHGELVLSSRSCNC